MSELTIITTKLMDLSEDWRLVTPETLPSKHEIDNMISCTWSKISSTPLTWRGTVFWAIVTWRRLTYISYVYFTQVMQAETLASAYRLWRRNWRGRGRESTAGALVWQVRKDGYIEAANLITPRSTIAGQ